MKKLKRSLEKQTVDFVVFMYRGVPDFKILTMRLFGEMVFSALCAVFVYIFILLFFNDWLVFDKMTFIYIWGIFYLVCIARILTFERHTVPNISEVTEYEKTITHAVEESLCRRFG